MEQLSVNALHAALEFAQIGKEIPTLQAIILFGSAAVGEVHKKSDIDLLLVFDTATTPETGDEAKSIYRHAAEIERKYKLENPFSFVFLNRGEGIDADFLWEVTKSGFVLYLKAESVIGRREFLTPSLIFSYSFQSIQPKDQMYVNRRLYGYQSKTVHKGKEYVNERPGLVQLYGTKLGRAVFIIDARKSDEVRRLFDERGILHKALKMWSTEQEAHMIGIMEIEKKRFAYLNALYDESDGNRFLHYKKQDIGREIGLDASEAENIVDYLGNEGLVDTTKEDVAISHDGIKEVEAARKNPEKPTDHFPVNIIHVGQMIGSQIAQASPGAAQMNIVAVDERRAIEEDLALLKEGIHQLQLPPEQESDLEAEMETIEAQMKSSKPKKEIVKAAYASIKGILQSAAGGVAAQIAIQFLSKLHF